MNHTPTNREKVATAIINYAAEYAESDDLTPEDVIYECLECNLEQRDPFLRTGHEVITLLIEDGMTREEIRKQMRALAKTEGK